MKSSRRSSERREESGNRVGQEEIKEVEQGNKDKDNKRSGEEANRPCQFCGNKKLTRVGSDPIWRCPACGMLST